LTDSCSSSLSPAEIAGIALGAGAVAGIVIGVVVCAVLASIGAKKGYDVWRNKRADMSAAATNPLYQDSGMTGINPFHEPPPDVEMNAK